MRIRGPDGVSYNLPDGLSDDDIASFLDERYAPEPVSAPEKSFGEKAGNLGRGFLESASQAQGGLYTTAGVAAEPFFPETGQYLKQVGADLQATDLGYEPTTTFEDVKQDPLGNIVPFVAETGFTSLPQMGTYLVNPAVGLLSQTGQISQQRAQNEGRALPTLQDASRAAPAALASSAIEGLGIDRIFKAGAGEALKQGIKPFLKDVGGAAVTEAITEGIQSPLEYAGGTLGTKAGFDPAAALEQSAAGALTGAGVGGTLRAGVSGVDALRARELVPYVKPGDVESPLPTDLIAEGRKLADDASKAPIGGAGPDASIPVPRQITGAPPPVDAFVDLLDEAGNVVGEWNPVQGIARPRGSADMPAQPVQPEQAVTITEPAAPQVEPQPVQELPIQNTASEQQSEMFAPPVQDIVPQTQQTGGFEAPIAPPNPNMPRPRDEEGRTYVKEAQADLADGTQIPVKYAIVEADSLITSNDDDLRENKNYPQELQPRNRDRSGAVQQVASIENNLNPRWLDNNIFASQGAPIVGQDNVVDSGNGRTIGIRRAYKSGKAEPYRSYLIQQYPEAAGYQNPVLVRVRQNEMTMEQRAAMNRTAQDGGTLKLSDAEQAQADAAELTDDMLAMLKGPRVDSTDNLAFVRRFNNRVSGVNDLNAQTQAGGTISAEGIRRINNALLAKAYGDSNIVASLTENPDNDIKNLGGALQDVAGPFAQMAAEAKAGKINPDGDVSANLVEAVKLVQQSRQNGTSLADTVKQISLDGTEISPITRLFLDLMFRNRESYKQPVGRQRLVDALQFYVDEIRATQPEPDVFGEPPVSPEQVLTQAVRKLDDSFAKKVYEDEKAVEPVAPAVPVTPAEPQAKAPKNETVTGTSGPENVSENAGGRNRSEGKAGAGKPGRKSTKKALEAKGLSGDTTEQFDKKSGNLAQRIYRAGLRSFGAQLRVEPVEDVIVFNGNEATGALSEVNQEGFSPEYWASVVLGGRSDAETIATLNHEGIHYLRAIGALDGVWPALSKKAQIWARDFGIKNVPAYANLTEDQQLEEAVAVAYAKWAGGNLQQAGFAARFFENLKTFLARTKAFFRSEKFTHWEDVFKDIKTGAYRDVQAKTEKAPVAAEPLPAARTISFRRNSAFLAPAISTLLRNDPAARQRINSIAVMKEHEAKIDRNEKRRAVVAGIEAKLRGEMETLLKRNADLKDIQYDRKQAETIQDTTRQINEKNKQIDALDRSYRNADNAGKVKIQSEIQALEKEVSALEDKRKAAKAGVSKEEKQRIKTRLSENARSLERLQDKLASANKMLDILDAKIANSEAAQDAIWANIEKDGPLDIKPGDKFDVFAKLDADGKPIDTKYYPATSQAKAPDGYTSQGQFEVWGQPGGRPLLKRELSAGEQKALKELNDKRAVQPMTGLFDHLYSPDRDVYGKEASMQWVKLQSDDMIRNFQDRFLDLTRLVESVEQAGFVLPDEANVDFLRRTWAAKAADRIEKLKRNSVDPILQGLVARDIDLAEFEEYLYAKVAPEVNAAVAKINPAFNEDEGSGMTNAEAARVLEAVEQSGKTADFEAIAQLVWDMNNNALDLAVESGLITADTAKAYRENTPHYVPLRGNQELLGDDPDLPRIGSGFSIKGDESKRRLGRSSKAQTILAYAISQAEQTIVRAEKNAVSQALIEFATAFPDENIWTLEKVEMRPVVSNGIVTMRPAKAIQDRDYTLSAKFEGAEWRLNFKKENKIGAELGSAFRNLDANQMNAFVRVMRVFTNVFKAINTRFSPNFTLTNLQRDLGFAAITLTKFEEEGLVKDVMRDYGRSVKAAYRAAKGEFTGEWGQWADEFGAAGSRTAIIELKAVADLAANLERDLKNMKSGITPKKVFDTTLRMIDEVNSGIEVGLRLAVYKNLRQRGYTKERAANAARRVTTDFNLRGKLSPTMNALYAFSGAAVQGTTEALKALTHKNVQVISGGLVVAGAMMALVNALISPDDEDGQSVYSKISESDKSRKLVFVLPEGLATKEMPYIRPVTLPSFFSMFWNLGRHIAEAALQVETPSEAAGRMAMNVIDSINPLGGAQSWWTLVAPTILDPGVELRLNQDWTGKPIVPEHGKYDYRPDSQKYYANTSEISKGIAQSLNSMTGGSDVEKGLVDVSPATLDYLFGYATGGTGRFFKGLVDYAQGIADPVRENKPSSLPLVGQFLGNDMAWYPARAFYDRAAKIDAFAEYAKQYEDAGRNRELNALYEKDGRMDDMSATLKESRRDLKRAKSDRAEIEVDYAEKRINRAEYAKRLEKNDAEQKAIFDGFNKEWNDYNKKGVIK
jgi:hypothetical protein